MHFNQHRTFTDTDEIELYNAFYCSYVSLDFDDPKYQRKALSPEGSGMHVYL